MSSGSSNRRQKREEQQVLLREKKREELLNRQRTATTDDDFSQIVDFKEKKRLLLSKNPEEVFQGVNKFRKNLSVEQNPPIQAVIDSGLVPRFVELLSSSCSLYVNVDLNMVKKIRAESAWALTNIASGNSEQTQKILDFGAIPLFADMLRESDEDLVDQAAWAFGNISGDSEIMRDACINCGVLKTALHLSKNLIHSNTGLRVLRNLAWLISNLNRGTKPPPKRENMLQSLAIIQILVDHQDLDIQNDSLWAVSYICDTDPEIIGEVFKTSLIDKIFAILENSSHYNSTKIIHPALRTVGNIISTTEQYVDKLINRGFVNICLQIFNDPFGDIALKKLRKEVCWIFSNISCGTESQVSSVATPEVLHLLYSTNTMQNYIKLEACWTLTNLVKFINTNYSHFEICTSKKYFKFLNDCIESFDTYKQIRVQILGTVKKVILSARDWQVSRTGTNLLIQNRQTNNFEDLIKTIEGLQFDDEDEVRKLADECIAEFAQDDQENENNFR